MWHLYPFRYDSAQFHGLSRDKFASAMSAEGIPCGGIYHEQYYDGLLDEAIASRGYKRLWSAERLKAYRDSFKELKGNKQVCETTVAMTQNMLLGNRRDIFEDYFLENFYSEFIRYFVLEHSAAVPDTARRLCLFRRRAEC